MAVEISEDQALSATSPGPWSAGPYRDLPEIHGLQTALFGARMPHDDVVGVFDEADKPGDQRVSDTDEIRRDVARRVGAIDTPRSQAVYGFLAEAGETSTVDEVRDALRARGILPR